MFDVTTFVGFHTWLSLFAIATGILVLIDLMCAERSPLWTALFLISAIATDVTGYGFRTTQILPSQIIGAVSLVVLAGAILARYAFHLAGAWRWVYIAGNVTALWFLIFVAIAQAFLKVPSLHAMAPTGSEPPFLIAQVVAMMLFVVLGLVAVRTFRPVRGRFA